MYVKMYSPCKVGGASYSVSAIRGEESRKRWMRRYWAYRKEQGLAAEVSSVKKEGFVCVFVWCDCITFSLS